MEQLQRQQEAKLEMSLQEKHLIQAQLLFAQHAAAAAARASGSRPDSAVFGKVDGQTYQAAQQALNSHLSRMGPDEEEQEMVEPEEDEVEEDEEEEKKPRLSVAGFPFPPYSTPHSSAVKQMSESPSSAIKQDYEEKELLSPSGQHGFTSPSSFADWSSDEPFKQVSNL